MGSEFTFYDYVVDEKNFIEEWLDNEVPEQVRAKFKNWLDSGLCRARMGHDFRDFGVSLAGC